MWEQFTQTKYKMLKTTCHEKAPWHVIRSSDKHKARLETMKLILNQINYDGKSETLNFIQDSKTVFTSQEELAIMDKKSSRDSKHS
jgi:hypothetical protein